MTVQGTSLLELRLQLVRAIGVGGDLGLDDILGCHLVVHVGGRTSVFLVHKTTGITLW